MALLLLWTFTAILGIGLVLWLAAAILYYVIRDIVKISKIVVTYYKTKQKNRIGE